MLDQPNDNHAPAAEPAADDMPRLLVVDDDNVHRMIICRIAAKVGYAAVEAASYDDAERLLRAGRFDCVSLDLSLGQRGGVDALYLIAEVDPQVSLIIISGSDTDVRARATETAKNLGLNCYEPLPKPVSLAALKQTLTQIRLRTDAGLKAAS